MRRADRLFAVVQQLRRREVITAAQLGARLEVSERTIYRDVADLVASGIPIEGEAGVGYRLGRDAELPPMAFTAAEIQALVLGARMVETWGDGDLRTAARSVLTKVEAVLPPAERHAVHDAALYSPSWHVDETARQHLGALRHAVDRRRRVSIAYRDREDAVSRRTIRPLGLFHWGRTWTVAAWCELRTDHRSFRLDRIDALTSLPGSFEDAPPATLEAFLERVRGEET